MVVSKSQCCEKAQERTPVTTRRKRDPQPYSYKELNYAHSPRSWEEGPEIQRAIYLTDIPMAALWEPEQETQDGLQ